MPVVPAFARWRQEDQDVPKREKEKARVQNQQLHRELRLDCPLKNENIKAMMEKFPTLSKVITHVYYGVKQQRLISYGVPNNKARFS